MISPSEWRVLALDLAQEIEEFLDEGNHDKSIEPRLRELIKKAEGAGRATAYDCETSVVPSDHNEAHSLRYSRAAFFVLPLASGRIAVLTPRRDLFAIADTWTEACEIGPWAEPTLQPVDALAASINLENFL